jgi:TonB family protein
MNGYKRLLLLSGLSLIFGAAAQTTLAADKDYTEAKLIRPLETTVPAPLRHLLMANPRVIFHVKVAPDGQMLDAMAVEATHYGLLEKAEERILNATFKPAILNGEPVVGKISVIVTFYDPEQRAWKRGLAGVPLGGAVSDAAEKRQYELNKERYRYLEVKPQELDGPLQVTESKLCLVHPPGEPARKGKVLVQYYIDFEGHIHMPKIIRSDDDYLSLSVLKTLENTRFAPPTRNGNPALVSVRQPFNFD